MGRQSKAHSYASSHFYQVWAQQEFFPWNKSIDARSWPCTVIHAEVKNPWMCFISLSVLML